MNMLFILAFVIILVWVLYGMWVEAIEGRNYALTSLGRRALELLNLGE